MSGMKKRKKSLINNQKGAITIDIKKAKSALERNGYQVTYFETREDAAIYINTSINGKYVGFGDSATLMSMRLFERLSSHNRVVDPQHCESGKDFNQTAKECLNADIFITSVNAISETGELVNIDAEGNRVAGSLFGHEKVYFVAGTNKLVSSLEEAIWRARNIAAPRNAMRLKLKTPCAKKADRCYDCSSPERICNGIMIHYKKMQNIKMEVVLINEDMGF